MSIDYDFKQFVLAHHPDVIALQRKFSRYSYDREHNDLPYNESLNNLVESLLLDDDMSLVYKEAERINNAYYARVRRLKVRIAYMLSLGTCFFITLTFNNDTLSHTSAESRRKYVTRFLKSVASEYVGNIDFGSKNGREHYHAVVLSNVSPNMVLWDPYGYSNAKVISSSEDFVPVAKYISKLTNHAVKATTRGCRAIYSR